MATILTAQNIIKSFNKGENKRLTILNDISLDLEKGKITVIVGASGAGKSTLLHILGGLDKPDSGKVAINSTEIFKLDDKSLSKYRNKNIGFIFQFHHLLPEFTAAENVAIACMINGTSYNKAFKRAQELLDLLGLSERINHKPAELSGGEQQRIAVARAMANKPEIIFADEPTGNLDSANSESMHQIFTNLKNEMNQTFLIVTHNPELVKVADNVVEMKDGKIISLHNNTN
ncbi:MAG: ABC transporter ATP-binding protein [bacterium]